MEKELFKAYVPLKLTRKESGSREKAIGSYLTSDAPVAEGVDANIVYSPNQILEKQLDLFYGLSVLVSEGVNKNSDAFLRNILIENFKTPRHKFVDWEHDVHAENKKANPDRYQVIGHIYDSVLSTQDGMSVPEFDVYKDSDGTWFGKDSNWRGRPLDIVVAWILYKFEFPDLVDEILKLALDKPDTFGVSMEVLFSDYKFRIGGAVSPTEDFDFDANSMGIKEVRKGEPLADMFNEGWNDGKFRTWNGLPVIRIMGGTFFFSGMAITANRANKRSWNISFAKEILDDFKSKDLIELVQAVAKKGSMDMSSCKIVNGEPDCECLEKAVASEIEIIGKLLEEMTEAISAVKKRKDVNPKSGEHKYGNVKFADEKNKKYPIDTPGHIRAAWNYIHKSKNSGKYSSLDVDSIKKKIVSAWKKHIDKAGPPSAAKSSLSDCPYCDDEMDGQSPSAEHIDYHMNDLENNLVRAQKKLEYLYEGNLDGDMSQEEIMEATEEIQAILEDSQSCMDIIK